MSTSCTCWCHPAGWHIGSLAVDQLLQSAVLRRRHSPAGQQVLALAAVGLLAGAVRNCYVCFVRQSWLPSLHCRLPV